MTKQSEVLALLARYQLLGSGEVARAFGLRQKAAITILNALIKAGKVQGRRNHYTLSPGKKSNK